MADNERHSVTVQELIEDGTATLEQNVNQVSDTLQELQQAEADQEHHVSPELHQEHMDHVDEVSPELQQEDLVQAHEPSARTGDVNEGDHGAG